MVNRIRWQRQAGWLGIITAVLWLVWGTTPCGAQFFQPPGSSSKFQLSGPVSVDEIESETAKQLQTVQAFVTNEQWADAVEKLYDLLENQSGRVVAATPTRYVALQDHCHMLLARFPAEGLALYRSRVDPQAKRWFEEGLARHDAEPLHKVIEQSFCSSWGDDALLALGELALESGQHGAARSYWEQILAPPAQANRVPTWLAYPDTNLQRSDVLARLVLVSILEGSTERARQELELFRQEFPEAEGRLGGRQVNYVQALSKLLEELPSWPTPTVSRDWSTFAGTPDRNGIASGNVDIGAAKWRVELPPCPSADLGYSMRRVGEDREHPLSYHPIVVGETLFFNTAHELRAVNIRTGEPGWGGDGKVDLEQGTDNGSRQRGGRNSTYGAARFTMTAYGDKLFARMGYPVTSGSLGEMPITTRASYIVCVEAIGGRLIWDTRRSMPLEEGWAFEGSPLSDGTNVYVGMRQSGARAPRSYVACLDAQTGRLRWRQFVAGAPTPAQGEKDEITHNLLTLHSGTLYYNTNLGAVAALDARQGRLKWIAVYPRAEGGDWSQRATHFDRDLTPCLYDRGKLYVAPADSRYILAYDAHSGRELWRTSHAVDAVHLLGVHEGRLIASGDSLWWFDTTPRYGFGESSGDHGGKTIDFFPHQFPEGADPRGFGRGVLVDDTVYWPTRAAIHSFNIRTAQPVRQVIDLRPRDATGGNLLVAAGHLLIVTSSEIIAFELPGGKDRPERATLSAQRPANN